VAQTRGAELTLAYRNVVAVAAGFRRRRTAEGSQLGRTPCVVFIVKRKLDQQALPTSDPQHLPRWLLTHTELDGQRVVVALPTDVQRADGFSGAQAHARQGGVWSEQDGLPFERGAVACAVALRHGGATELCLLSAQHVMTPCVDVGQKFLQADLPLRALDGQGQRQPGAVPIATTRPWGGLLRGDEDPDQPSFDVQLARLDAAGAAAEVVGAPGLSAARPWLRSATELLQCAGKTLQIVVPVNHPEVQGRAPLPARLDALLPSPFAIRYQLRRGDDRQQLWVYHRDLIKLDVGGTVWPRSGDSGSAVVLRQGDGVTLVGLYIGGSNAAAYVIPAWRLFDPGQYWSLPVGATLSPQAV
jgi:hypothetical protein